MRNIETFLKNCSILLIQYDINTMSRMSWIFKIGYFKRTMKIINYDSWKQGSGLRRNSYED